MGAGAPRKTVDVDGRLLELSNLDKVLYPRTGTTKAEVIDYYARVAPALLRHVGGRPLSLRRCPDGVEAECFFEKNCPGHRPDWIRTVRVDSERSRSRDGAIEFCVAEDRAGFVWLANLAALELHPYLHNADETAHPTLVVFDLDPGPPAGLIDTARVALRIRRLLGEAGLVTVAKTSGSKGLQVYVPLNRGSVPYERTGRFAQAVARLLEQETPGQVVSTMAKARRAGRVFVDWSQNNRHKTTIGAYSMRIGPRPTVSTPVSWEEVEEAVEASAEKRLDFETGDVLGRVEDLGDLFAPVADVEQDLPDAPS
jgi:bifunctional non-homologous end joining protein LigD